MRNSSKHPDISCDNHIHTSLCNHASGEMEDYVLSAIAKGLDKIIFLEHMEEGISSPYKTWLSEQDFDLYFSEGRRLRAIYADRINTGLGVECGYNPERVEELRKRLAKRKWDQIGISCHFLKIEGVADHLNMFSRKKENIRLAMEVGPQKLMSQYLLHLIEAVDQLPGTMLCHLDGALRHVPEISLNKEHYRHIERLLEKISKKNMVLEVNCSGINLRGQPFPNRRILEIAADYHIPLVLSSDAHHPQEVGRHFADIQEFIP